MIYLFVVLIDPYGILPFSPGGERWSVADARLAYPALARSPRFDSAIVGTSTSRLLRPAALDPLFDARFVNLAMDDATVFEQASILRVFLRAHANPRIVMVGLDVRWCVTGETYPKLTFRRFPSWMYGTALWRGYAHMLDLYTVQEAGQEAGILLGLKRPTQGSDGYTSFVPPDNEYDAARAEQHLRLAGPYIPEGERAGPPQDWRFPALETLSALLQALPDGTRKILFFVPYDRHALAEPGSPGAALWSECKRRVARIADATPNTLAVDFMIPSPITSADSNYWDPLHFRIGVADRLARDLADAAKGKVSPDGRILADSGDAPTEEAAAHPPP